RPRRSRQDPPAMSFQIRTTPADHQFNCEPGETILSAALRGQVGLPYGCRNGTCGSCAALLVSGQVAYPSGQPEGLAGKPTGTCLTCQAMPMGNLVLGVAEVKTIALIEVRNLPCRVLRKELLSHDVMRLLLKLPEQQRLQFFAGQYLEFILRDGRRRAFSIANPPHDDAAIELHVRRVPNGEFTRYIFDEMQEKTILRLHGPLGTFTLREDSDRPLLLVGGGTGFAPLKAMIEHAFHVEIERPIHLYWGVRARRDLYLPDLPLAWARAHPNFSYTPVLSEPDPDWAGRTGFVHQAVAADHPDLSGFDGYLSGPPPMVEAGRIAFTANGLPGGHLYSDAFEFAADTRVRPGR
ncbi:MAG TPA: CDP-6-deoxy-delta-3,4-glucoseen reductase, partial [Lamprocystis sp. (in: g-proteobacteria)]|nr:CDP-6-deoxy-delta-3,4-glucoseen reductase [Lamprocystis sp. (in: g-proteobacteria)]